MFSELTHAGNTKVMGYGRNPDPRLCNSCSAHVTGDVPYISRRLEGLGAARDGLAFRRLRSLLRAKTPITPVTSAHAHRLAKLLLGLPRLLSAHQQGAA